MPFFKPKLMKKIRFFSALAPRGIGEPCLMFVSRIATGVALMVCLGLGGPLGARAALVGYWNFNDNTADQSGNGLNGTVVGSPTYDTSVPTAIGSGKSIHFDGTNDWVNLGDPPSLDFGTEGFTFGGWIKTTQPLITGDVGKGTLFSNGGDRAGGIRYTLTYNETTAGYVTLVMDDNVTKYVVENRPTLVNDGQWHHVVGVRDGTQQRIYIDGQPEGTNATLTATYDLSGTSQFGALIGAAYSAADLPPNDIIKKLEGNVDDVFVWRGVLSDADIAQLASGAATPLTLAASAPPSVSDLVPQNGEIGYSADSNLTFTVSGPRTVSSVMLFLNGQDVTSSLAITGNATNKNVTFSGLQGGQIYDAQIVATDNVGASATNSFSFDTFGSSGVLIEAEDYNYGVDGTGMPVTDVCAPLDVPAAASSGGGFQDNPPPSGFTPAFVQINGNGVGYLDTIAVSDVDFSDTTTTTGDANVNNYRTCTPVGVHATGDFKRLKYTSLDIANFDLELQNVQAGEWLNYTRTFPNSNYIAYLRVRATAPQQFQLSQVTSSATQPSQTTALIGVFDVPATSGYEYVPLIDLATGQPVVRSLSGVQTIRLTAAGANNDAYPNFIVFLPTTNSVTVLGPVVSNRMPAPNATAVDRSTTISADIVNRDRSVNVSTIQMLIDDAVVSATKNPTGGGATVSYTPSTPFPFQSMHTVTVAYDDNMGASYSNQWSFLTTAPAWLQDDGPEGLVVFQAEHYARSSYLGTASQRAFQLQTDHTGYTGEGYMVVPNGSGGGDPANNTGGLLEYDIEFVRAGTYYVWVRGSITDVNNGGGDDSFYIGLDGMTEGTGNQRALSGINNASFVWSNDRFEDLNGSGRYTVTVSTAGIHTFDLYEREDGSQADKILLTDDPNYTPAGDGPPESLKQGAPTVTWTTPTEGQAFAFPADVTLTVDAVANDNPPVKLVEFFEGTNKLGEATSAPYSITWNSVPVGYHTVTAIATDNVDNIGKASVTFSVGDVTPPTVAITAPTDGATLPNGTDVQLTADASDNDSLANVEFYVRGQKVGEAATGPFTMDLGMVPEGAYTLQVVATDAVGLSSTNIVRITVGNPPQVAFVVADPANVNTSDTGAELRLEQLGFDPVLVSGPNSVSADANGKVLVVVSSTVNSGDVNTKFRDAAVPVITWEQALQDDFGFTDEADATNTRGGVGGQTDLDVVDPSNPLAGGLPAGVHTITTSQVSFNWGVPIPEAMIAATQVGDATHAVVYGVDTGATLLGGGTAPARRILLPFDDNTYQVLNASGLTLFDAAVAWAMNIPLPTVSITSPTEGQVVAPGADVSIAADASSADGITKVEFYMNATKIGEATASPYTATATNLPAGPVALTARAFSGNGYTAVALVNVLADNTAPTIVSAGSWDGNTVRVCFSEPLDKTSAETAGNYQVNGGAVSVVSAMQQTNETQVLLTLSGPISGDFTVTVNGVTDQAGLAVATDSTVNSSVLGGTGLMGTDLIRTTLGDNPVNPGEASSCVPDGVDMMADGGDIWNEADAGYFLHAPRTGDFDVKVQVISLRQTDVWAKAGLMARADVTGGSQQVIAAATPQGGYNATVGQERPVAGGASVRWPAPNEILGIDYPNEWIRMRREGDTFIGYKSTNGVDWVEFGRTTNNLPATVELGLAVTSHSAGNTTLAEFRNYGDYTPVMMGGRLSASLQGGQITISWTGTGTLQSADDVEGPWTDVTGATNPYTTAADAPHKFFRLAP